MPKGPKITDEVKRYIAEVNERHPEWVAKEVMSEVHNLLSQVNPQIKPDWPGLSAVQILLKKIRDGIGEREPFYIDIPWSMGTIDEYPIPSEIVPKLFEIKKIKSGYEPLSIREAKWVGRLYTVIQDPMELACWAKWYAKRDKICELSDTQKDTSDIDDSLSSGFITIPFYFAGLFNLNWVPDTYKTKVTQDQCRKYENYWGLDIDQPELTGYGWLIYAHWLQGVTIVDIHRDAPKGKGDTGIEKAVLYMRDIAKKEGRLFSDTDDPLDLLKYTLNKEKYEKWLDGLSNKDYQSNKSKEA